jgi:predicted nucleotidyltransferase
VSTEQANLHLKQNYPQFIYFSPSKQAHLHAVSLDKVFHHHQPRVRLKKLLANNSLDKVERDLQVLCSLFEGQGLNLDKIGITGSILIGAQKSSSDIDLVFYSREVFNQTRTITQDLIKQGRLSQLNEDQWKESWDRRSCDLSYKEYVWHEKRKFNKAMINKRKFDLSLVSVSSDNSGFKQYTKLQSIVLKVQITDDSLAYDYPAEFLINHNQIKSIVCYTATYTGQAINGEWVEVAGIIEQTVDGLKRIVVGSSREAKGEYIKVVNE